MLVQFSGGKPRSCEDLKARYYAIARALAVAREGSEENIANHKIVKHPFNAQHERYAICMKQSFLDHLATISSLLLCYFSGLLSRVGSVACEQGSQASD